MTQERGERPPELEPITCYNHSIVANVNYIAKAVGMDSQLVFGRILSFGLEIDSYRNCENDGLYRIDDGFVERIGLMDEEFNQDPQVYSEPDQDDDVWFADEGEAVEDKNTDLPVEKNAWPEGEEVMPITCYLTPRYHGMARESADEKQIPIEYLMERAARLGVKIFLDFVTGEREYAVKINDDSLNYVYISQGEGVFDSGGYYRVNAASLKDEHSEEETIFNFPQRPVPNV